MSEVYVPSRGNPHARIMLIGEAPGAVEEKLREPFRGPAGNVLSELLLKSGIDPSECYFTNVCKYRPPDNDLSLWFDKGIPNDKVLAGCGELKEEIARVNPNVIVPMGNYALWATYHEKKTGITDLRGYVLEGKKLARGRKVIPTLHPSYLLRGNTAEAPLVTLDLDKARRESLFPEIRRRDRELIIDPQGAERDTIRERLLTEGKWLGLDIEFIAGRMLCIGFAVSSSWGVTIPIKSPADMAWCQSLVESGRPLLAQNAMFDLGILEWRYHWNVFRHLAFDTMVAAYNLNIEYPKDLGFLAGLYTDLHPWWEEIDGEYWKAVKRGTASISKMYPYNCLDNISTYEIAEKQDIELDSDPKLREAFQFDMSKMKPLWEMACRGVPVDVEGIERVRQQAIEEAEDSQLIVNHLAEGVGIDLKGCDFNVKSSPQKIKLIQALGGKLTKKTPADGLAVDNKTLMEVMRTSSSKTLIAAITHVLRVSEARDIQSKFTEIEWDDDGRARCIYDATKTTTRRLSSKKFFPTGKGTNLQNIPAPSSSRFGDAIRRCFVPDMGFEFAYADLKGAEFLVVAELTQDPLMLRYAQMTIDGSGDVHRETAAYIFSRLRNKEILPADIGKDSPERFLGKKTRHSGNYMIGWKQFMENINKDALRTGVWLDAKTSKALLAGYTELHPGLPQWWNETEEQVRRDRKLRNLFGFVRRFNGSISQNLPVAVAFVPQSTVGDYLNYGLLACANDYELAQAGFQLLLQIHDAIGYQYPIENRDFVNARVRQLMDIGCKIPKTGKLLHIPVEIQCGPSWGEEKVYEDDIKDSANVLRFAHPNSLSTIARPEDYPTTSRL